MNLACMLKLLNHANDEIKLKTLHIIRTISNGNRSQINAVAKTELLEKISKVLQQDNFIQQKHAADVFSGIASNGSNRQKENLFGNVELVRPYYHLLGSKDLNCVSSILYGLDNLFAIKNKKVLSTILEVSYCLRKLHLFYAFSLLNRFMFVCMFVSS